MTDQRLLRFIASIGYQTMVGAYETEDDEAISHFVWLLDVQPEDLCKAQDKAILLAFSVYDPEPVPFVIGVADAEKSQYLRAEVEASQQTSAASGTATVSSLLDPPNTTEAQASRPFSPIRIGTSPPEFLPTSMGQPAFYNDSSSGAHGHAR
jgi:hypothetical protein